MVRKKRDSWQRKNDNRLFNPPLSTILHYTPLHILIKPHLHLVSQPVALLCHDGERHPRRVRRPVSREEVGLVLPYRQVRVLQKRNSARASSNQIGLFDRGRREHIGKRPALVSFAHIPADMYIQLDGKSIEKKKQKNTPSNLSGTCVHPLLGNSAWGQREHLSACFTRHRGHQFVVGRARRGERKKKNKKKKESNERRQNPECFFFVCSKPDLCCSYVKSTTWRQQ